MLLDKEISRMTGDGEFEVDLRPRLDVYLRYSSWEKGLRVYRWDKNHWEDENIDPGIPLITGTTLSMSGAPVHRFIHTFPQTVQENARMFYYNQTTLLQASAQHVYARDLLCNNPVLLWFICHALQHKKENAEFDNLIRLPQHEILRLLTRNGSKIAVRFLRKVRLIAGSRNELRLIVWALKRNWLLERMRHMNEIPISVIAALYRFPELYASKLLYSLPASLPESLPRAQATAAQLQQLWQDTAQTGHALNIANRRQVIKQCNSVEALQRLHDRWVLNLNARHAAELVKATFPEPPFKGDDWIQPIRTLAELHQEGIEMKHCIASYVESISCGKVYIYRVLRPQRATLEVKLQNGKIELGQCCLEKNGTPSESTLSAISQWLDSNVSKQLK